MPETLATIQTKLASVIQDVAALLSAASAGDREMAIREALEHYDNDAPRAMVADIAGDGATYDLTLPAGYVDGFSSVVSIEYPTGSRPAQYLELGDWTIYRTASTTKLRLQHVTPGSGQTVRVTYTARHTIDDLDSAAATTIPAWHTEAFVNLCGAKCLVRLADRFIHEQESTLNLDAVDRTSKTDLARRMADRLLAAYREVVGVRGGASPAGLVMDWTTSVAGSGLSRLTHRGRVA